MINQIELDFKEKIKEKKESYLSKLISKKKKFELNLLKKRPKYIFKSNLDMVYIIKTIE